MKINKTIIAIMLFIVLLLALYQFVPKGGWQGDGTPLYTIAQGRVHGGVYVEGGHGYTRENPYIEYFEVPAGVVKYARLYIPIWNYDRSDTLDVTVNGNALEIRAEPDYIAAWGVAGYSFNATSYVHTGTNNVKVSYYNPDGGPYGITLVAVYEDPALPSVQFWINEGNYALAYTNGKDTTTTTLVGSVPGKNATLYTLIIAGTKGEIDELYFDSNLIGRDVGGSKKGKFFDMDRFNVTLTEPESTVRFERGDEGYIHPFAAVLISESENDRGYIQIYEQQAVKKNSIPVPVIVVSLITFIAIAIRYLTRKK